MNAIPQMQPWFDEQEANGLRDYMSGGGWITEFKKTSEFEALIAAFTGARHCILTNNGTVSLSLGALASGIQAGDEVIVPNYTMIATPNSIVMIGATPVFVDVEPSTLCMDFEKVNTAITAKTRAVMLVAANGRYPEAGIKSFERLCREKGLILIEDSAQALGSWYPDGRHIGRAGHVGSFSFSAPKIISTGQGGALITDHDQVANRLRKLKDFGRSGGGNDVHDSIGYNFKFTELQAVVGIEQMKKLPWRVERKKQIMRLYRELLSTVSEVRFFNQDLEHTTPWFIDILVERRDELQSFLKEKGVGTRVMYPPINEQKAYERPGAFPVSKSVGDNGLWLPSFAQISDDEVALVCELIVTFFRNRDDSQKRPMNSVI